jgi:predicted phage terminase large subunit-like protein
MFRREWFPIVDQIPGGWISCIRFWDRAATQPSDSNKDPDWTRGMKLYKYADGTFVVADLKSLRDTPGQVEKLILSVASHDGLSVKIMSQIDPGSAGIAESEHFIKLLAGYNVETITMSKDKITRAKPVSAQAEFGNIRVLRAPWNESEKTSDQGEEDEGFFKELGKFPNGKHDDIVDTLSGSFNQLAMESNILDYYRNK